MIRILDQEEREKALRAFEQNILVIAGAGTGKTSLLTGRVLTALLGQGISPERILVTTFTEPAAEEMAKRIEQALLELREGKTTPGSDAGRALAALGIDATSIRELAANLLEAGLPSMQTIHSFCLSVLRDYAREADLPPGLEILDGVAQEDLFSAFFQSFLDQEFGKGNPILSSDQWDLIFRHFTMEQCRELIENWMLHPRWADLPLDKDLNPLLERAGALYEEIQPHITLVRESYLTKRNRNFEKVLVGFHIALKDFLEKNLECQRTKTWKSIAHFLEADSRKKLGIPPKYPASSQLEELGKKARKLLTAITRIPDCRTLDTIEKLLKELWDRFQEYSSLEGKISFDDMIERARRLLGREGHQAHALDRLRQSLQLILVDEFQDTDPSQNEIFLRLGNRPGSLFVVGDPKQSIYRFRGADMEAYEAATEEILTQGSRCTLSTNFRSHPKILAFVNQICSTRMIQAQGLQPPYDALTSGKNFPETQGSRVRLLRTECPKGEPVAQRRIQEARALGTELLKRRARMGSDDAWRGIGVLVRKVDTGETLTNELRNMGVPVLKEGGKKFFERFEVQRYLALLRLMVHPHDEAALLANLRSPLAAVSDQELLSYKTKIQDEKACPFGELLLLDSDSVEGLPGHLGEAILSLQSLRAKILALPADLALKSLLKDSGLQVAEAASFDGPQRLANLELFIEDCAQRTRREGYDLHVAFDRLQRQAKLTTDFNEASLFDPSVKAVRVMTIHKAKGLEFDLTILADLTAEPSSRTIKGVYGFRSSSGNWVTTFRMGELNSPQFFLLEEWKEEHEKAEERRLEYVAMTRARNELWLSWNYSPNTQKSYELPPLLRDQDLTIPIESLSGNKEEKDLETTKGYATKLLSFDQVDRWIQIRKRLDNRVLHSLRPSFLLPSREEEPFEKKRREGGELTGNLAKEHGEWARDLGVLCHLVLQRKPLGRLEERMEFARKWVVPRFEKKAGERVLKECEQIFSSFESSPLQDRLRAGTILGQEMPILHRDQEGKLWRGTIDLLLKEAEDLVVVDYKTNILRDGGLLPLSDRYQGQIQIYREAIQAAFMLQRLPHGEIWALRGSLSYRYPKA
jgi:ATP-dependent helicase/nuclease subunit A